jgi:hypothetical protein
LWAGQFVKQGVTVTNVGKGELNAAFGSLGTLTGIITPMLWGRMYQFFLNPPAGLPRLLNWGHVCFVAIILQPAKSSYLGRGSDLSQEFALTALLCWQGGVFGIAAALNVVSWLAVRFTPASELFLEEGQA